MSNHAKASTHVRAVINDLLRLAETVADDATARRLTSIKDKLSAALNELDAPPPEKEPTAAANQNVVKVISFKPRKAMQ